MNIRTLAAALSAIVSTSLVAAPPAAAQDLPKRKTGLWEITMENSAAKGTPVAKMTMTQCVDAAKDDIAAQMSNQMDKENKCSRGPIQQSGGKVSFSATCEMGGTKMTSQTTLTGDFSSSYKTEIRTKFDPPMMGMAEGTTTMDAKFVGACKPGMRPGDVTMPGGMTMNMYDMMGAGKK